MSFQLFSPSSFPSVLCFMFVILAKVQLSLCNFSLYHETCNSPFKCGDVTADYPFWIEGRREFCGHPELKLTCEGDGTATMMIKDIKYRVLKVDDKNQVLKIARLDYLGGICPPKLQNTNFDYELFDYSSTVNLTLLYCTGPEGRPQCSQADAIYEKGFIHKNDIRNLPLPCDANTSVIVPVPKPTPPAERQNRSSLEECLKQGFEVKWLLGGFDCLKCRQSNGSCGYTTDLKPVCYCPNRKPSSTECSTTEKSFNKGKKFTVAIAASVAGIVIILSILLLIASQRRKLKCFSKKKTENDQNMEAFVRNYGKLAPTRYNYSDVKKMTKSFSNKLGQGGYGDVYKGKLPDGRLVAVKVLKASKGNGEEFINEVASISRTSHVNIVAFLGFCYERKKRVLMYEYMPNGSLDKFIYDEESSSVNRKLEWRTRYQIAVGIARGLEYLHRGCNIRIVHFDIKPHNILLDEDFCPKISDFGLSKLSEKKESIIPMLEARGTVGYIAPEVFCRNFGGVSHKSDVYSYGMMILEMVGGRKNINVRVSHTSDIYFPDSIYKRLEPGADFELQGVVTEEEKELAKKMILVSLWCIQTIPSDRPSMTKVVDMLEGSLENLQIPPKPSLSSPARSPKYSSPASSSPFLASCEESSIS